MNLFYFPEISASSDRRFLRNGALSYLPVLLPEDESSHCLRVLRMKMGDAIFLTDGKGMFYQGEIISDHPQKCRVKIIRAIPDISKRNFHLTIAIAPTKNMDRFEWFLEKATEIGCDEIIPICCKHSERTVIKTERLNKLMASAMKQCLKSQLPQLHQLQDFKTFINRRWGEKKHHGAQSQTPILQKFIGHIPSFDESEFPPQNPQGKLLSKSLIPNPDFPVLIAIGPEGGFSEEEVAMAMQNGFRPVSLGSSRLRVETAGVVACSLINAIVTVQPRL